jgi:glycosyltransferase involved in cell wall biosynthesis
VSRVLHLATVDVTLRFLLLGQLRRLREEGFEVHAMSAPGPWVAEVEAEGIRHVPWRHVTRTWDPGADARAFAELLRHLRRERYHVVHTHTPKPGVLGRVAARLAGVPAVVNTVHGLYATPESPPLRRAAVLGIEGLAARFGHLELYQSEEDLAWARRTGVAPRGRARLLGNGTDLDRFSPDAVSARRIRAIRRELGIPRDALVVGTVGRLVAEKGYRELLGAVRDVAARVEGVRLLCVAPDDPEKPDALRAAELSDELVIRTGWRADLPELLAAMDVFVLASWREGVPRSAIEAAAMALPLVLTDIRGCREVVRDGREGILVPARDRAALAGALVRLLEDPPLRARLGAGARARAEERFDERPVADRVVAAYRELLGRQRRRSGESWIGA